MRPLSVLLLLSAAAYAQAPIRGFSADQAKAQHQLEQRFKNLPEPDRIRTYLEHMSKKPHHAGSPASKEVADYALGLLREWGLDARIEEFEALLPYPTVRSLEMTAPVKFVAALKEPAISEDPNSGDADQLPTYNAYSAAGDVTAPVVYVNYGVPEDYDALAKLGVDVKGKIVLTRYGKSWRGVKPKVAYEHGAIACLIYSDPHEDGYFAGDVYPKGPFRPEQGVQRGSVMDMAIYAGDPLSPGWASEKGSKRLTREEAKVLMKIPVMPISYGDALPLLQNLGGPVAPEAWRGSLPVTYHVGPGATEAHLKLDFDWGIRPLYDVIATIPGGELADQWIIYGNHHDAWVNGANDPLSGASALLETARSLAILQRQGWKPKRTIKLALWDGEEFGLVGSTEWAEKHATELAEKGVAYFNSDSNGKGPIGVSGSPILEQFINEVLRDLNDPVTGKNLIESSRARGARAEPNAPRPTTLAMGPLGAGSDYVPFTHHLGVASLNMGFGGDSGGIYHSIYDTFAWYTRFSDGTFVYGKALAQVMGTSLMRLADAPVLPFEFSHLSSTVARYVDEIKRQAGKNSDKLDFGPIVAELGAINQSSEAYERRLSTAQLDGSSAAKLRKLNETIYQAERTLTLPQGLPGRDWFKHQISAPGLYTGYGAKTLPGVREAVEAGKYDEAQEQTKSVLEALKGFQQQVDRATRMLQESGL